MGDALLADGVATTIAGLGNNPKPLILAKEAARVLADDGMPADLLDLRELEFPLCGSPASFTDPNVARGLDHVTAADGIIQAIG